MVKRSGDLQLQVCPWGWDAGAETRLLILARNGLSDEEACTKVMAFILLAKLEK